MKHLEKEQQKEKAPFSIHAAVEKCIEWGNDFAKHFGGYATNESFPAKDEVLETLLLRPETLSSILPYETYDEESDIYINQKSMGFICEMSPMLGASEEDVNILASLLTDVLPDNTDIQFLQYLSPKISPILDDFQTPRMHHSDIMAYLAEKRAAFLGGGAFHKISKESHFLLRDIRIFLVISLPKKGEESTKQSLIEYRDDIVNSFQSLNIYSQKVSPSSFIGLMGDMMFPDGSIKPSKREWDKENEIALQIGDNELSLSITANGIRLERAEGEPWEIRSLNVNQYPRQMAQWKMGDAIGHLFKNIHQITSPTLISMNVRLLNRERAMTSAQAKVYEKDNAAKSSHAKFLTNLGKENSEWLFVRDRLSEGDRLVHVFFQVLVMAPAKEIGRCERKIIDIYKGNEWKLSRQRYLQFQSYLSAFPMMMTEGLYKDFNILGRFRRMTAFNAVNLAPLQGEWKGSASPVLLLSGRRGQLLHYSPFDSSGGNYNVAVAAKSGSGKSVLTQEYITGVLSVGGRVWVVDIGRSYEKTCKLLNGEFIAFDQSQPICINPFTYIRDFTHEALPQLKPLLAAMARPSDKTTREEENFLEQALKHAWDEYQTEATITEVAKWLEANEHPVAKNLALLLYPYTKEGMYGSFFEGKCNVSFDNLFVVLELQELKGKKDLMRTVLLVMMYHVTSAMYLNSDRSQIKSCIIDEAWDLLDGDIDGAVEFIEAGYRTARRFRGNFVTITQSLLDYYKNKASFAAFENSDHNWILAQKEETLNRLEQEKKLSLDGYTTRLYKSLRTGDCYSEMVIKSSQGLALARLPLDPYSRILFSSKGQEYNAVKQLTDQGVSLLEAVEEVAKRSQ